MQWVAMPSSRESSQPRDRTGCLFMSPALSGRFFTTELQGKSYFELHIISEINSAIENIQIDHFSPPSVSPQQFDSNSSQACLASVSASPQVSISVL